MDINPLRTSIELELQKQVSRLDQPNTKPFHEMLTYHMGWTGEGAGPDATGKRIRPLMVLLCTAASGGDWQKGHFPPLRQSNWCTTFHLSTMIFKTTPPNVADAILCGQFGAHPWRSMLAMHCSSYPIKPSLT